MQNKKADISIPIIIIAVIALIVLIVLVAIFSGRMGIFSKETGSQQRTAQERVCWAQPGYCSADACKTDWGSSPQNPGKWTDCQEDEGCCIKSGASSTGSTVNSGRREEG